ncbi:MAG: DUF2189 domain-containing protein, partial [Pseudomonadota bacterium]
EVPRMVDASVPMTAPDVRQISRADVTSALRAGLADFQKAPMLSLAFGAVFSVAGIGLALLLLQFGVGYWLLPLAAGFPLIGPFAAVGLYEISRRLEAGEPLHLRPILAAGFRSPHGQLPLFAVLAILFLFAWLVLARVIFAVSFGTTSMTNVMTSLEVFLTPSGLIMLAVGSVVGAALASLLFAISVVGVPLLVDRDVDVVTAIITSVRATLENQGVMLFWGLCVAVATIVAMLPLFLGMILVFPVLGHTSWHLYRALIPDGTR